jgi:hypothetical protein
MKITGTLILAAVLAAGLGCGYSKKTTPAMPGAMPTITQLSPASATSGGPAFTLEVDGTNFAANAIINFNGAQFTPDASTRSSTKLETTIPATAIMNSKTVPVTVTNPGTPGGIYGGGTLPETSAPMNFMIN